MKNNNPFYVSKFAWFMLEQKDGVQITLYASLFLVVIFSLIVLFNNITLWFNLDISFKEIVTIPSLLLFNIFIFSTFIIRESLKKRYKQRFNPKQIIKWMEMPILYTYSSFSDMFRYTVFMQKMIGNDDIIMHHQETIDVGRVDYDFYIEIRAFGYPRKQFQVKLTESTRKEVRELYHKYYFFHP